MVAHGAKPGNIESLPVEVLDRIMSFVSRYVQNQAVLCMQVCKHWNEIIPLAVSSLTLIQRSRSLVSCVHMMQFRNLSTLKLDRCTAVDEGWKPLFVALGKNYPSLAALHLTSVKPSLTASDVSVLFHHCPLLRDLSVVNSLESTLPLENASFLVSLRASEAHCLSLSHSGSLTKLKTIDLSHSVIHSVPALGNIPLLETLDLSHCLLGHDTIPLGNLPRLRNLYLNGCTRLRSLPGLAALTQLQTLDLLHCTELDNLPSLATFPNLRSLSVAFTKGEKPACLTILTSLTHLQLCDGVDAASLGLPLSLKDLSLSFCAGRPSNLSTIMRLTALTSLSIEDGDGHNGAFECVGHLARLQKLRLHACQQLSALPTSLGALADLQELTVSRCVAVERLAPPPGLWKLLIENCESLQEVALEPSAAESLRELTLNSCGALRRLPPAAAMAGLTLLVVDYCHNLEDYPEWRTLYALRELSLHNRIQVLVLPALPYRNLEYLDVSGVSNMRALPDMSGLLSLKRFKLCNCPELEGLPVLNLPSLKILKFILPKPETLPSFDGLPALEVLTIMCVRLRTVPSLDRLRSLRALSLMSCRNLEALPRLGGLTSLRQLSLNGCSRLASVSLEGLSPDLEGLSPDLEVEMPCTDTY